MEGALASYGTEDRRSDGSLTSRIIYSIDIPLLLYDEALVSRIIHLRTALINFSGDVEWTNAYLIGSGRLNVSDTVAMWQTNVSLLPLQV